MIGEETVSQFYTGFKNSIFNFNFRDKYLHISNNHIPCHLTIIIITELVF